MLSTESRSLRTLRLLKRFSGTIEKFEKTLVPLNKKEGCAVVVRRVAAKSCECNALPAADALMMKRQKLEKDLFCPNTSDKTEGPALVRRVAAIDHKPVRRPPSANEGLATGRRVAAKSCESIALPADALLMRKRRNELEMERNNLKRREAIQKKREAARRELEQMRNTAGIYDPLELVRDLEKMLGYSITGHMPQPALPLPAYYKSLIKTDDMICCCDQDQKKVQEGEIVENCLPATKT